MQVPGAPGVLFSESKYGVTAKWAARAQRDALVLVLRIPVRADGFVKRGPQRNSRLGILGIHPAQKVEKGRRARDYIRASCRIDGVERHKDFYYGPGSRTKEAAIRLATRARADLVAIKLRSQAHGPRDWRRR